jgi:hypothetical protein
VRNSVAIVPDVAGEVIEVPVEANTPQASIASSTHELNICPSTHQI